MIKKLSEDLTFYRIDRPDEWLMGEFREKAITLEDTSDKMATQFEKAINIVANASCVFSSPEHREETLGAMRTALKNYKEK